MITNFNCLVRNHGEIVNMIEELYLSYHNISFTVFEKFYLVNHAFMKDYDVEKLRVNTHGITVIDNGNFYLMMNGSDLTRLLYDALYDTNEIIVKTAEDFLLNMFDFVIKDNSPKSGHRKGMKPGRLKRKLLDAFVLQDVAICSEDILNDGILFLPQYISDLLL